MMDFDKVIQFLEDVDYIVKIQVTEGGVLLDTPEREFRPTKPRTQSLFIPQYTEETGFRIQPQGEQAEVETTFHECPDYAVRCLLTFSIILALRMMHYPLSCVRVVADNEAVEIQDVFDIVALVEKVNDENVLSLETDLILAIKLLFSQGEDTDEVRTFAKEKGVLQGFDKLKEVIL